MELKSFLNQLNAEYHNIKINLLKINDLFSQVNCGPGWLTKPNPVFLPYHKK